MDVLTPQRGRGQVDGLGYRFGKVSAAGGIAFRASSAVETNFTATVSPVINAPAGLADGDLIIIGIACGAAVAATNVSNGFTLIHEIQDSAGDGVITSMYKIASGEGATWTFTNLFGGSTAGIAGAVAYTGVDQTTPLSGTATEVAPAAGTSHTCTAMTPGHDNTMVIGIFGCDPAAGQTGTAGGSFTERADFVRSGDGHIFIEEFLQGTAASIAASFTSLNSDTYGCIQLALKPA